MNPNTLTVFDRDLWSPATLPVADDPGAVAVNSALNQVHVGNRGADTIQTIVDIW